ncbi:MAG: RNA helicase [Planctomycetes bacterium]|jgi:ATP-dependent RNA helicase RhlE|nr:RNA helicase [Planctomycetota bacterium]MDP6409717.1 DEAD/DEAH box helicase [Planctomycetota bacterium]
MNAIRSTGSKGSFATFGLSKNILRAVTDAGFQNPRPIQARTIPEALRGRDILGLAQTGTGKTAAFALPIIERLAACRGRNPRALILAPTRELALQIHDDIQRLAQYTNVSATTVFGGVKATAQVRALRKHPDIVVACPGRLLDLMGSGDVRLEGIEVLVLDEADHMLDMGFLPDIKRILASLPTRRQNLLFSATMPREIRSLTTRMLREPHVAELEHSAPLETIDHALYPVAQQRKTDLLLNLLNGEDCTSALVFLRTKHRARRLARDLDRAGLRAIALQGNMSQAQRQRAMQGFRDGRYDVLVATDIAARGIDVAGVSHVINFDIPGTPDAYTHRIGRTGRAECSGKALTFATHEDFPAIKAIERKLNMQIPRIKLREFGGGEKQSSGRGSTGSQPARSRRRNGSGASGRAANGHNGGDARGYRGPRDTKANRGGANSVNGKRRGGTRPAEARSTESGRGFTPSPAGPRAAFGAGLGNSGGGRKARGERRSHDASRKPRTKTYGRRAR